MKDVRGVWLDLPCTSLSSTLLVTTPDTSGDERNLECADASEWSSARSLGFGDGEARGCHGICYAMLQRAVSAMQPQFVGARGNVCPQKAKRLFLVRAEGCFTWCVRRNTFSAPRAGGFGRMGLLACKCNVAVVKSVEPQAERLPFPVPSLADRMPRSLRPYLTLRYVTLRYVTMWGLISRDGEFSFEGKGKML